MSEIKTLKVLKLVDNECTRKFKMYRKTIVGHCKELTYLDQLPVNLEERKISNGWAENGKEGME